MDHLDDLKTQILLKYIYKTKRNRITPKRFLFLLLAKSFLVMQTVSKKLRCLRCVFGAGNQNFRRSRRTAKFAEQTRVVSESERIMTLVITGDVLYRLSHTGKVIFRRLVYLPYKTQKPERYCVRDLELVIRIELMTSSLPMTCSTD